MAEKETKDKKGQKAPQAAPAAKGEKADKKGAPKEAPKSAVKTGASARPPKDYVPRLKKLYREQISKDLLKRFAFPNVMLVPKLDKIVLNVGVGLLHSDQRFAESLQDELRLISGMKPVLTKARKSISNFKLRQGMVVGCRVTLRGDRMFEFLDRLISIVIPRIRDFRGISDRSFDGRGNFNFGVKEQIMFPEIDYDKVVKMHGMDICIATTARTDEEALELLKGFGFPFRRRTGDREAA
jgi:large subunit ribosomal protein L5